MNRIRELRQSMGWTQTQLGARVGMAKTTISGYEKGDHQVDPEMICRLCDLFDCSADYLLCRSTVRNPTFTDEEARLLEAFRAADHDLQDLIRRSLKVDMGAGEKKAVS